MSLQLLEAQLNQQVVGQPELVRGILLALLASGHVLVEGAPGLAKTRLIKTLAESVEAQFSRIQFTPDLLPSDVTGSEIYHPEQQRFAFHPGPVFANLVLADEINRAPAKVQAALLEAMAEQQISVAGQAKALPEQFFVMATQNPIEQEGTYSLPEAQLDRFMLHLWVDYPSLQAEQQILELLRNEVQNRVQLSKFSLADIKQWQSQLDGVFVSPAVDQYLLHLVDATRNPAKYDAQLAEWIDFGVSPRASFAFDRASRALALLEGRDYVTPDDIQTLAPMILRHRVIRSFQAIADGISANQVINQLISTVAVA
jgi:MoxR-like ATPase